MFRHLFKNPRTSKTLLSVVAAFGVSLVFPGVSSLRQPARLSIQLADHGRGRGVGDQKVEQKAKMPRTSRPMLQGAAARQYLQEPGEGQSLMQAITVARFGLKSQEHGPFGEPGSGYLGTSHEQNLNAWFAGDGVTVRPTVAESERAGAWHLELRLKAYGYGNELVAAPPIVSQRVKDNRIEYERAGENKFQISNFKFQNDWSLRSAIGNRQSAITEWYENRAEGIEQGFTIAARPERRGSAGADEPLRLVVALSGELRAHATDEGRAVELTDAAGKRALSYGKLTALDAGGKLLTGHMEASTDGSEIALVVDDRGASYPITVDPLVATLENILDAGGFVGGIQAGAQFGDAVAIDGDLAVVGAWLEDSASGVVYTFFRRGSTWDLLDESIGSNQAGAKCGYSVAISDNKILFGCPGANASAGIAVVVAMEPSRHHAAVLSPGSNLHAGDFFGASVAIVNSNIVVGAPATTVDGKTNVGLVYEFTFDSMLNVSYRGAIGPSQYSQNARFGDAVAINEAIVLIGVPGTNQVVVDVPVWASTSATRQTLQANDSAAGDLFGQGVALSGYTAVIGAPANDEKGPDAGAAYVFVRDANGQWSQQQKLTASDGQANDIFSYDAVAIYGNTIVVGARRQDLSSPPNPNDNSGAAYIFTRNVPLWTQQRKLTAGGFYRGPGDEFGTSVGISNDTVIVGAPHETATEGTVNAGTSYVYRLDCVPPYQSQAQIAGMNPTTVCPGASVTLSAFNLGYPATNLQWRKNGINLPDQNRVGNLYVIQSANSSDSGVYDAIVSNACGSEISRSVTLLIHTFSLNLPGQNFGAAGSNGSVTVSSTGSCAWSAVSNSPFITVTSGATGTAPGAVNFTVAANPGPNQRTGTITIADKTFTVTQDGLNCSYSITPTTSNFSASSNADNVSVTANAGCAWTATSNDNWLTVTSGGSGTGNGATNYLVAANSGPARTGTLTVAGQTVTVTQASGCTFALSPSSQNFPASIAAGSVNITSGTGCAWTATSNSAFISVTSGASGTGNGNVGYSLTANDTATPRTGTMTIGGQTFTVTQDGAIQNVVQFSSSNYSVVEDCTTVAITVNRLGDASGAASVDYATSDVTASERKDYIKALGTLRFAAGETAKSFAVLINEDSFVEGNETFNITLSNPVGVSLGGPAIASVTIIDDAAETTANPIDDSQNYVCQQYHDFLNRQPDAPGLAFWTNQITACGTDSACIEARRINVSAAFFLSIEFQDSGYLIERIYKTAFGDATGNSTFPSAHQLAVPVVRLNEFLADTQEISQGVIVGQGNWQQQIENNKQAFTAEFVLRPRFATAFPLSMAAAEFVDTLNRNAGNPLSSAERDQLVNDLSTNAKTRAQVLRAVAEDTDLNTAEFNRAFVLMQYFGYSRRNPNDSPDSDHTGYDFWLTKLNQFNGNYLNAEMVKAFITSIEYRQRFGP
jgi:hypothetical protein